MAYRGGPYGTGTNRPARRRVRAKRKVGHTPYGGTVKVRHPSIGGPRGSGSLGPQRKAHRVEIKRINRSVKRATIRRKREAAAKRKALDKAPLVGRAIRQDKATRGGGILYTPISKQGRANAKLVKRPKWQSTKTEHHGWFYKHGGGLFVGDYGKVAHDFSHPKFDPLRPSTAAEKRRSAARKAKLADSNDPIVKAGLKVQSGAAKVLDIAGRPYHATTGAVDAAITGKDPLKAAGKGLSGKGHATGSDILKHLGVKNKAVRAIGGFGVDMVLDPLTHGKGQLGNKAAGKLAAKGVKDAETRGIQAGVRVRVPFKEKPVVDVHTSGRTTAAVARKAKKLPGVKKAGEKSRDALHESVMPDITPSFRTPAQHKSIRNSQAHERAQTSQGERAASHQVQAFRKAVPDHADRQRIVDAIETQTVHKLPPKHQTVARALSATHARELKAKQDRQLLGEGYKPQAPDEAKAFFPHVNKKVLEDHKGGSAFGGGSRPAAEHTRQYRGTLKEENAAHPGLFIAEGEVAHGLNSAKVARQIARADLMHALQKDGKPFGKGAHMPDLEHELVYEVTPRGPKVLAHADGYPDTKAIGEVAEGKRSGRFVVLNKKSVEEVMTAAPRQAKTAFGRGFDKGQGTIKALNTIYSPAFQPRNFVGDSILAWQADTSARSFKHAKRMGAVAHAKNKYEKSAEALTEKGPLHAKYKKLADEKVPGLKTTYGEELEAARKFGARDQGFAGAELRAQIGPLKVKKNRVIHRGQVKLKDEGAIQKVNNARENLPRTATYLSARKRGMSEVDAAEFSRHHHIDYGDRTKVEQAALGRAFPFYTFFARNSRLQAEHLLKRPGKVATLAKAYDEAAKAAGFDDYKSYVESLPEYQQKGLPWPLQVGKNIFPVFTSPPQTDLNQITISPGEQLRNLENRLTFYKTLPELVSNYSLFFQDKIEDSAHPTVPAPQGVEFLPKALQKKLGVRQIYVKGKKVWGWSAKSDYAMRSLTTQTNTAVAALKPSPDARGLNGTVSVLTGLTGVKIGPDKTLQNTINRLYQERKKLDDKKSALQQSLPRNPDGTHVKTKKTIELGERIKKIDHQLGPLRIKAGVPANNLPFGQRPKKGRKAKGGGTYGAPTGTSLYGAPSGSNLYGAP